MAIFDQKFIAKTTERMGKTFLQFYLGNWMYFSHQAIEYSTLFTVANAKAGVVGVALSLATSIGTKNLGPDKDSPSLV